MKPAATAADAPAVARSSRTPALEVTGAGGRAVRGDIEGLRAIAVATVLAYHVGLPFLPSGFAGVDIFFVISGFLITSLLVREIDRTGRVSLARFYARRARRLLPAACLVLVVTTVVGWWVLPVSARHDLSVDVTGATLYVVNWVLAGRAVDYLAEGASVSPVQHYWSLSVEEQYYVVWPLLLIAGLWLAGRRRRGGPAAARRVQVLTVAAVALVSFAWSVLHTRTDPAAAYFVSTTRFWELAVGSLLAFAVGRLAQVRGRVVEVVGWAGLALLVWGVVGFSADSAWPGWAAAVPVLGAAAVIGAGCTARAGVVSRLLAVRPLVRLGGISYSLYLWHWPVIVLARVRFGDPGPLQSVAVVLLSIALAWASKHLVEDPWRFSRALAGSARALVAGATVMAVAVVGALTLGASVPTLATGVRVPGATSLIADPDAATWRVVADPSSRYSRDGKVYPQAAVAVEDSPIYYGDGCQMDQTSPVVKTDCTYGDPDSSTTVALLGDSKMGQWFAAVDAIAKQEHWKLQLYLKSACAFSDRGVRPDCSAYTRNVLDHLRRTGAPTYALVSQHAAGDAVERGLQDNLRRLRAMGTTIIVVAENPSPRAAAVYDCVEKRPDRLRSCGFASAGISDGRGTVALAAAARELDLRYVDLNPWICPTGPTCPAVISHTLVYRQGSHLTDTYIRTLTPILHRALSRIGVARTPVGDITADQVPRSLITER